MIKAFTYMFKDNRFIQKSSIYFLFLLIGTFCTNYANILLKAGGTCTASGISSRHNIAFGSLWLCSVLH